MPFPDRPLLLVEIVNQTDWWQPYVPPFVGLLGSVVVASVAFIGITRATARTYGQSKPPTIANARDGKATVTASTRNGIATTCSDISSEAVRVSREISRHYNEAAGVSLKLLKPEEFEQRETRCWEHMDAAQTAIDKVAPLFPYDMMLLGKSGLCVEFSEEVRQVGEFVRPAFVQYHRYLVAKFSRIRAARRKAAKRCSV